jgi:hypothetical protein
MFLDSTINKCTILQTDKISITIKQGIKMKNKHPIFLLLAGLTAISFLSGCESMQSASNMLDASLLPLDSATEITGNSLSKDPISYHNSDRKFSFTLPGDWKKQQGDVNSDSVLFMATPISRSCAFQFHINRMQSSFPAKASAKASLNSAKKDMKIGKLKSAKSRNQLATIKDKQGKDKRILLVRGWQVEETGTAGGHQRFIYQVYDRNNYYINFMGSANTEQFAECRTELKASVDSITFEY